jgi:hypothetical protein
MVGQWKKLAAKRLFFEQGKIVFKWYWKFQNVCEAQKQWLCEFATEPPTRMTVAYSRDKYEANGRVQMYTSEDLSRPCKAAMLLELLTISPQESVKRDVHISSVGIVKQDGALLYYHRYIRSYLDETLPGRWTGRRDSSECLPRSPDLIPSALDCGGSLKDVVHRRKPLKLEKSRKEIETWPLWTPWPRLHLH